MMFFLLGSLLIVHFLIFMEQIPYDKVWAGKLNSVEEMKTFEAFSIAVNILIMSILFVKYRLIVGGRKNKIIDIFIWAFVILFALNTVGNLFSKSMLELILGTALTLVSSVLCFVIVRKEKTPVTQ